MITDERLDFSGAKTVPIKNELYVVKEGHPIVAYKYTNVGEINNLTRTTL